MKSQEIIALHLAQGLDAETLAQYYRQPLASVKLMLEAAAVKNPGKFKQAGSSYYIPPSSSEGLSTEVKRYDPQSLELSEVEQCEKKVAMFKIIETIAHDTLDENKHVAFRAAKFCLEELNGRNERKLASTGKLAANTLLALEVGKLNAAMSKAAKDRGALLDAPILDITPSLPAAKSESKPLKELVEV